ncbi:glutamine--fructose-6-phosphate transaminase (isomerizing) [archaeon]|nr:glutamine--fructose-6-phosphate transaminase (isomerizing) [archaeon]|tara:strand:+ start:210 stop:2039 length:1830 start_codon:yes stop_codon:yes gene_type:complete
MCGITAYVGDGQAYPYLLKGLERLEYRGYDSAGVATVNNGQVQLHKTPGKVEQLKSTVLPGKIGISHTRWATHGPPTKDNAHPHLCQTNSIALVHNGIIENYAQLRGQLQEKGYTFKSDTDTEVLVQLMNYYYGKTYNMEMALRKALHDVVGAYGIVAFHKDDPRLYAARKGSPLVVGIGDNENFVASDPAAFLDSTRRVLYLEDEDIAVVSKNDYEIKSLCVGEEECVHRTEESIDWDLSSVEKNGFEHFMLKEIMEQPESLKHCLAGRIDLTTGGIKVTIDLPEHFVKRLSKISIVACGTSSYAAYVGKYLIEKYSRIPVEVDVASEWRYKNPIVGPEDLVIVISQSGETADTLAALREAKKQGARSLGVINVVGSSMAREVDSGIYIHAGPEIGVASTKAFTGQVVALNFLALRLAEMRKDLRHEEVLLAIQELEKTPELVTSCLKEAPEIKEVASQIKDAKSVFFIGRGVNLATAMEGALKLKEISYIHSEFFPAGEMKHGPIALLEPGFPVVTFVNKNDPMYEKNLSSIQEAKARGAFIIAVADHVDAVLTSNADAILHVPTVPDILQPIINVIPLQLLAYYVALARGCEIDQPRNLAKSVTVE